MTLSRTDIETLLRAGIEIVGGLLRVEDIKNKVTYEFPLDEIGQLTLKKRFRLSFKRPKSQALVVHKWDMSRIEVDVNDIEDEEIKTALKRVNDYFYTES